MAYTATVEKVGVNKIREGLFQVSIKLTVNDGTSDIFTATASAKYNSITANLDNVKTALINDVKDKWDKFNAEQVIFNASAFDTMVSEIQTLSTSYVNQ